jgi:hypothetical protein
MRGSSIGAALLAVACLAGCATADTVKNAPVDAGIAKSFDAPYERTVAATLSALAAMKVSMHDNSEEAPGRVIMVNTHVSAFSWGEVGRVIVKKSAAAPTTVVVNWSKRDQLQITGTSADDFSSDLFVGIETRLAAR